MSSESKLYEKLSFGIVKTLEKRQGVCDIRLADRGPCDRASVIQWEQKYSCMMTDDLRNFYLTSNGFSLQWCVKMNENRIPVGRMDINSLEKLVRIGGTHGSQDSKTPSLLDVDMDLEDDHTKDGPSQPTFDHHSRIFELDGCEGFGKVCYVYRETKPGIPASKADIWFLDRSFRWHFLANTFIDYYRMMIMHLGLPQWQYSFTDIGLSPHAKQWYNMYSPMRLGGREDHLLLEEPVDVPVTQLDISRVFKGKVDKKKLPPGQQNLRKKPTVSSAKGTNRTPGSSILQNRPIR